jgi:hypothetical protein
MCARRGNRGQRHQLPEPERLKAEIVADQVFAFGRGVALVEHQVNRFQDGIQARAEFAAAGHFQRQAVLPDLSLGAHQPLRDCGIFGQKCARNLAHAEAAHCLQAQRHA